MQKSYPDIETDVLTLLRAGPMKQVDIVDRFPMDRYMDVSNTVRDMAVRGVVEREKCGATYWVRPTNENTEYNGEMA